MDILTLLVETNLATSKSEARRLIKQKAIKVDGRVLKEEEFNKEIGEYFI